MLTLRTIIKAAWRAHALVSLLMPFFSDLFQDDAAAESVDDPPEDFVDEKDPQWTESVDGPPEDFVDEKDPQQMGRSRSHSGSFGGFEWDDLV